MMDGDEHSSLVVLQVNGMNIESMKHSDVVAFIKEGGDETWLLVVDPETDEHFKSRGVIPTVSLVRGRTVHIIRWSCATNRVKDCSFEL